jgi:AbrB family looped-hinge helix DNA binding protein
MPIGTVTSKGQITLPKGIRQKLKLVPGKRVTFVMNRSGGVTLTPLNDDFRSLRGILKSRRKTPLSIEEMNEIIAAGWAGE